MSGTIKRSCIWLTIIHSNPGDEFYCEISQQPDLFNCDNCKMYIDLEEAREFEYKRLKLLERLKGDNENGNK